jgi:hypothetical protein
MADRFMDKDPTVKLARERLSVLDKRLSVLELAQELGSVSKACKQTRMDRTAFYEWKRRFQAHGLEGLEDLPPVHKNHPGPRPITFKSGSWNWPGKPHARVQLSFRAAGTARCRRLVRDDPKHPEQTWAGQPL